MFVHILNRSNQHLPQMKTHTHIYTYIYTLLYQIFGIHQGTSQINKLDRVQNEKFFSELCNNSQIIVKKIQIEQRLDGFQPLITYSKIQRLPSTELALASGYLWNLPDYGFLWNLISFELIWKYFLIIFQHIMARIPLSFHTYNANAWCFHKLNAYFLMLDTHFRDFLHVLYCGVVKFYCNLRLLKTYNRLMLI